MRPSLKPVLATRALLAATATALSAADAPTKKKVLIITGDDAKAHDWSKQVEPLAFTLTFGAGRVFNHTFGHDVKALSNPAVRKLILRGTAWAAGDLK